MNIGDRVRVRNHPDIVFNISRQEFNQFGRQTTIKSMTERMMPITVWYEAHELEVIE